MMKCGEYLRRYSQKIRSDENFDVIVNAEKGDLEIMPPYDCNDGEVNDPGRNSYKTAKLEPILKVGEELYEERDMMDFGRRASWLPANLATRIIDLKKNVLVKKYNDR